MKDNKVPVEKTSTENLIKAAVKLLDDTVLAWDDNYGIARKRKAVGKDAIRYTFITGGWSENEYLQSDLDRNSLLNQLFWLKSERGGLTIYEVFPIK